MSEIKQYAVLEYIVDVLQKAIVGSKVQQKAPDQSAIIDGNASIIIQQRLESNGSTAAILIKDQKEILYSEELLEKVYKISKGTEHPGIKTATNIVINGLSIEAELIFHAIRDQFYSLSDSYEFLNFIERDIQQIKFNMNFGDDLPFELIVLNQPDSIAIEAVIGKTVAPAIQAAINADVKEIRHQINKQFKKDEVFGKSNER
jgi:hypothetical protein